MKKLLLLSIMLMCLHSQGYTAGKYFVNEISRPLLRGACHQFRPNTLRTNINNFSTVSKYQEEKNNFNQEDSIPRLSIDDTWERIAEVTTLNCWQNIGTFNEKLKNPGQWLAGLARSFCSLEKNGELLRRHRPAALRDLTIDSIAVWETEVSANNIQTSFADMTRNQETAFHNLNNILVSKARKEINK